MVVALLGVAHNSPAFALDNGRYMREYLIRVALIDWRLRRAALKDCVEPAKGIGMIVDAQNAYAGYSTKMGGDLPEVIGLIPSAAAQGAGLAVGDHIVSIEGVPSSVLMRGPDGAQLPENMLMNIDRLTGHERLHLEIERLGIRRQIDLAAEEICSGLTIVRQSGRRDAYSDLHNIAITTGLLDRLSTDDQIAFIIGHELAHTIFADSDGNGLSRIEKEKRADLYGVHVAACAGFDPIQAIKALATVRSSNIAPILSFTHPSYKWRQQAVAEYLTEAQDCEEPFHDKMGSK